LKRINTLQNEQNCSELTLKHSRISISNPAIYLPHDIIQRRSLVAEQVKHNQQRGKLCKAKTKQKITRQWIHAKKFTLLKISNRL